MSPKSPDARASLPTLAVLFLCTAIPMAMWNVPLANIFTAYGRGHLVPWVLATTGIAAFISPLFVGALADQRISATRLMRWLAVGTAMTLTLTCASLMWGLNDGWVLLCAQVQSLIYIPVWSIASSIVFSQLSNAKTQFGPLRAFATLGWMCGCWIVSLVLKADASLLAGFTASALWLGVAGLTFILPPIPPGDTLLKRTWSQTLGLDALSLLRHRDHRVVFITAALYSVPLAAFYPYTARHLKELGVENVAATISLAQTTEILTMVLLSSMLTRIRLKWVFLTGIGVCVVRYGMNAQDTVGWIKFGTTLHGFAFTLYFITTQIYLEDRIDPKWRVRAQALLALLMGGFGNLIGYLGGGWWHEACQTAGGTDWHRFWWGETLLTAAVFVFFVFAYRGRRSFDSSSPSSPTQVPASVESMVEMK